MNVQQRPQYSGLSISSQCSVDRVLLKTYRRSSQRCAIDPPIALKVTRTSTRTTHAAGLHAGRAEQLVLFQYYVRACKLQDKDLWYS